MKILKIILEIICSEKYLSRCTGDMDKAFTVAQFEIMENQTRSKFSPQRNR